MAEFKATGQLTANFTLTLSETEARALAPMGEFSAKTIAQTLGRGITEDLGPDKQCGKGLISLLESTHALRPLLKAAEDARAVFGRAKVAVDRPDA